MELSRIDIIGLNGNDGLHYMTQLPTDYQKLIHLSRYSRWLPQENRRETWEETVERIVNYFKNRFHNLNIGSDVYADITAAILHQDVMPSMRLAWTAGPALDDDHIAAYNCYYQAIDNPNAFDEAMYILMCGTGVGFSVESQYVSKLPVVAEEFHETETTIVVADSRAGWAKSYRELITMLYAGQVPKWDVSKVRPAGSRLKRFGGRASGPEPLVQLFEFTIETFKNAAGRQLTTLEAHDIMCMIADIVVVGGVRRSALLSLSDLSDNNMRYAKSGDWYKDYKFRGLANNSACYTSKPDITTITEEWLSLYQSKSGERGIFSRDAAKKHVVKSGRRDADYAFGTNPCSEIILRSNQFCNLSEVVVRHNDTFEDLQRKVRLATILGTMQATLTDFKYITKKAKRNTEEERLLGVSLTGIMDHPLLSGTDGTARATLTDMLHDLKETAIETNLKYSKILGIPQSTAITCVKPSGTVSQLVDSSSGIHPRYSPYYIRGMQMDNKDPVTAMLKAVGVPNEPYRPKEGTTTIFYFPQKSPTDVTRNDLSAIAQLELWKTYAIHWCEHKPSVSIYVREHEWLKVLAWVHDNFDIMSGVSFFPHSDHVYEQAPYTEATKEEYLAMVARMPVGVDFYAELQKYETEDCTTAAKELACTAGQCEI